MNPNDMMFQAISNLTGGLITDMTTVMVALLTIGFIIFGFNIVVDVLSQRATESGKRKNMITAENDLVGEYRRRGMSDKAISGRLAGIRLQEKERRYRGSLK